MIQDRDQMKKEPYVHQDYPGVRYKPDGQHKKVNDATEDAQAAAEGFSAEPPEPGTELIPAAITGPQRLAPAKPAPAPPAKATSKK